MNAPNCSDAVRVTIASLVKLVGLMGAELLVGKHRDDVDSFELNVRAKLHAALDGVSAEDTAAGVALAHSLIEPVLANLRERVRQAQAADASPFSLPADDGRRLN